MQFYAAISKGLPVCLPMKLTWLHDSIPRVGAWVLFGTVAACVGLSPEARLAEEYVQKQDWDRAVAAYRVALQNDPLNDDLLNAFAQVKSRAAEAHFAQGRQFLHEKRIPEALQEIQIALGLNPAKAEHHTALVDAVRLKDAQVALQDAEKLRNLGRLDEALGAYERAIELDPDLTKALDGITAIAESQKASKTLGGTAEPVTLRFQNTRLKQVFEILARTANLNIIFEKDVRDDLVTIFTKDLPFDEALNLILTTNQLFARKVAPDTLLIIPDTKQKRQQFQDLQIRTFYLSTAKAKDIANLLRTILETKRVYVNEQLNTVVLRDEPEKMLLAEQVIMANDRRDAEVVFDVEVLEVNRNKTRRLGANFAKQAGAGAFVPGTTSFSNTNQTWTFQQLVNIGPDSYLFTFPSSILLDFFKSESDAKTLASPKLRVLNNQKASINIGDKQPILLSTTNVLPGQASTGVTPTTSTVTSIEFKDTGIKLDMEPNIHLTGEITLKMKIEVTRLGDLVRLQSNPVIEQFRFGTRTADTTLNMKDGETVILAGLIQEEDRLTRESVPGIDDIPIIKDLFFKRTDKVTTEVVLAVTPHIVRNLVPPTVVKQTLWSGTADNYALSPLFSPQERSALDIADRAAQPPETSVAKATEPVAAPNPQPLAPLVPAQPQAKGPVTPPVPQPAVSGKVSMNPAQITTRVGQSVQLAINAEGLPQVDKAQLTITYDPAILEFSKAMPGQFFGTEEGESGFTVSAAPQSGQIILQFGRPGKLVEGSGQLGTLIFTAKATGQSPLVIRQSQLSKGSEGMIRITAQHGLIRVL